MEDYNTATLPHRKYYDLELYERQRAAKAARKGIANVVRGAGGWVWVSWGGEGRGIGMGVFDKGGGGAFCARECFGEGREG
jgi:hypothetical protein